MLTPQPPSLPVLVGGLIWQMSQGEPRPPAADALLSGPAMATALGVASCGEQVRLLVAVPQAASASALRLLRALDADGVLWHRRPQAPLRWHTPAVIGTRRRWQLDGDPRGWSAEAPPAALAGRVLALANGPPAAYAAMLASAAPRFTAFDLDARWAPSQPAALAACVRLADLLTLTRTDYQNLPPGVFAGSGAGQPGGPLLIIKDGANGAILLADGKRLRLPPAAIGGPLRTDVGAGDLLLGALAARLGRLPAPPTPDDCASAYHATLPLLARLLGSASLIAFAHEQLALHPEACDAL
nr:hypothetical protein [uncultured Duganella sp.]